MSGNSKRVTACVKSFRFRVVPNDVMKEEYPSRYYKFRNEQIAKAFAIDSCGNELKTLKV